MNSTGRSDYLKGRPAWIVTSYYPAREGVNRVLDRQIEQAAGMWAAYKDYAKGGRKNRTLDFYVGSRSAAEAVVQRIRAAGFNARYSPGRNAHDDELKDWNWKTNRPNPLNLDKKGLMIAGGVAVLGAIALVLYSSKASAATNPVTPVLPPNGGIPSNPPTNPTSPPTTSVTSKTFNVTETDSGKSFNMNVGDTVNIVIAASSIPADVASYVRVTSGVAALSDNGTTNPVSYTAIASGTEVVDFNPVDTNGNPVNELPLTYTFIVS